MASRAACVCFPLPLLEGDEEIPFVWISNTGFVPEDVFRTGAGVRTDGEGRVELDVGAGASEGEGVVEGSAGT